MTYRNDRLRQVVAEEGQRHPSKDVGGIALTTNVVPVSAARHRLSLQVSGIVSRHALLRILTLSLEVRDLGVDQFTHGFGHGFDLGMRIGVSAAVVVIGADTFGTGDRLVTETNNVDECVLEDDL